MGIFSVLSFVISLANNIPDVSLGIAIGRPVFHFHILGHFLAAVYNHHHLIKEKKNKPFTPRKRGVSEQMTVPSRQGGVALIQIVLS